MVYSDIATLISEIRDVDSEGYVIHGKTVENQVFCNVKSASQSEFYKALAIGVTIAIVFDIPYTEYNGQKLVKYDGKLYRVIRTFRTTIDSIELSCTDMGVDGNG